MTKSIAHHIIPKYLLERLVLKMSKIAVVYWSGTGNTETMASETLPKETI